MPHIVDRRKMKKQQFFATPSQVYNIYYTESVPTQQLPSIAQNLTKSFPQLGLSAPLTPRTRKIPRSSGLFRRNRHTLREKNFTDSLPYFPEEYHRRQIADFTMNQLKVQAAELYQNQNFGSQNHQNQTPCTEYQRNALVNYGNRYTECQGYQKDVQNVGMNRDSPQGSPTSINSSLSSCNQGMLNNSSQIITVPTQPMSSGQGYSMKIEVLAQPLKSEEKSAEKLGEDFTNAYEAAEFMRQKSVEQTQNVIAESNLNYVVPVCEVPIQCTKKKKKISIFTKIVRRIRHESSQPAVSVCKPPQIYSGENLQPEVSQGNIKTPVISIGEGYSKASSPGPENCTNEAKETADKNELYTAQEILSPRQMISSTTNMCSVKTDVKNIEPVESDDKTIAFANKEAALPSDEIANGTPSFQDVMAKLEDTLSRYRFESDAERKLFANVITNHLKQHGIKLNIYEQFVAELMEKEKKKKANGKNTTTIEEFSEKESDNFIKSQRPSQVNVHKKFGNQNVPGRSQVSQINEGTNQSDNQTSPSSPNTICKSGVSSLSYICGSCKCRNPPSLLGQEEDLHSLKRESAKKGINIPKDIDDDLYNWKALYERDVVQNSYRMFDTNHGNILSAHEDDQIKYQHWLKLHSRTGRPSCQECVNGGTSSRNSKSTACSENLETPRHHSLSHRRREREHSPPERDISSKSLHDNNRFYHASLNPSVSGFEHIYLDPDAEPRRYPQTANLACCGLVMYGKNESVLSLAQGQCCHRTIPVCGTVSRGVSPRYEPNFTLPYHEQDPCYLRRSHPRGKTQRDHRPHRNAEKGRRHYHHHISEFEREGEEEGEEANDSQGSLKGAIDAGLSPPLMLRNLAKAANTVLATIFGRSTDEPLNQERQYQQQNIELRSKDTVVTSKSKRSTYDAMRQQQHQE